MGRRWLRRCLARTVAVRSLSNCPPEAPWAVVGPVDAEFQISLRRRLIRHSDVLLALWGGGTRDCGRLPTGPAVEGTLKVSRIIH